MDHGPNQTKGYIMHGVGNKIEMKGSPIKPNYTNKRNFIPMSFTPSDLTVQTHQLSSSTNLSNQHFPYEAYHLLYLYCLLLNPCQHRHFYIYLIKPNLLL